MAPTNFVVLAAAAGGGGGQVGSGIKHLQCRALIYSKLPRLLPTLTSHGVMILALQNRDQHVTTTGTAAKNRISSDSALQRQLHWEK